MFDEGERREGRRRSPWLKKASGRSGGELCKRSEVSLVLCAALPLDPLRLVLPPSSSSRSRPSPPLPHTKVLRGHHRAGRTVLSLSVLLLEPLTGIDLRQGSCDDEVEVWEVRKDRRKVLRSLVGAVSWLGVGRAVPPVSKSKQSGREKRARWSRLAFFLTLHLQSTRAH